MNMMWLSGFFAGVACGMVVVSIAAMIVAILDKKGKYERKGKDVKKNEQR